MNLDTIVSALEFHRGKLPREALRQAMKEKELVAPKMIQVIRDATNDIQKIVDDKEYFLHIHALFLLAQFRETEAHLPIVEFFSMPGEQAMHATGDVVTEYLGRILASTFNGDVSGIKGLIEGEEVNEYVRCAALQALGILWGHEKLSRQQVVEYAHTLLNSNLFDEYSFIRTQLIYYSLWLSPNELEEDIKRAFDEGLVDTFFCAQVDFENSLGFSNEEALERFKERGRDGFIENTVSELERWPSFGSVTKQKLSSAGFKPRQGHPKAEKIGRNDPCPCGSGKKYKKCCL